MIKLKRILLPFIMLTLLGGVGAYGENPSCKSLFSKYSPLLGAAVPTAQLKSAVDNLLSKHPEYELFKSGKFSVLFVPGAEMGPLLTQIGRLREERFRMVGEGTNQPYDTDTFDSYYHHLFVWNSEENEIAGAYRIGFVDKIFAARGVSGIYSHQFFKYAPEFIQRLHHALELGRSFVAVKYSKQPVLDFLFRGVAEVLFANPDIDYLFGPVSISNVYSSQAKAFMVDHVLYYHPSDPEMQSLIHPSHPYNPEAHVKAEDLRRIRVDKTELSSLSRYIEQIEGDHERGIPPLIRYYTDLLGAKFLSFNVDNQFNSLDGLIVVKVDDISARILKRYLGAERAQKLQELRRKNQ